MARLWSIGSSTISYGKYYYNEYKQSHLLSRAKFGKATRAIAENVGDLESFCKAVPQAAAIRMSMDGELKHDNIIGFLETVPSFLHLTILFAPFLVPVFDLVCDLALLRYIRDEINWFKLTVLVLTHLVKYRTPQTKLFR